MIWISIIGLVLQLVTKLPAVQEWLERIFGTLGKAGARHPVRVLREGAAVKAALEAKLAQVAFAEKHGLAAEATSDLACPLAALAEQLETRYAEA